MIFVWKRRTYYTTTNRTQPNVHTTSSNNHSVVVFVFEIVEVTFKCWCKWGKRLDNFKLELKLNLGSNELITWTVCKCIDWTLITRKIIYNVVDKNHKFENWLLSNHSVIDVLNSFGWLGFNTVTVMFWINYFWLMFQPWFTLFNRYWLVGIWI